VAKIISLLGFKKSKLWRALKQRLERGEVYLPPTPSLRRPEDRLFDWFHDNLH